jgi:hypothetical protein
MATGRFSPVRRPDTRRTRDRPTVRRSAQIGPRYARCVRDSAVCPAGSGRLAQCGRPRMDGTKPDVVTAGEQPLAAPAWAARQRMAFTQ